MNIVGPMTKSAYGHKYMLVIMDYVMLYLEELPLRKATSPNIARELVLFSCVGIPKDILMAQGTPFISRLIQDQC